MQTLLKILCLSVLCLFGGSSCTTNYILSREDALRIRAMSQPEYEQAKVNALREEASANVAGDRVTTQVPVTVQAQKLDLKHGKWLDWQRLRTSPKRPEYAVVLGVLGLSLGIALSISAAINQFDNRCVSRSTTDLGNCFVRDFKTSILGGFGGAFSGGGLALTIFGAATWSPEVRESRQGSDYAGADGPLK